MTTEDELRQLNARVLEKNKVLSGISANPDFQNWLDLVPKAEMVILQAKILGIGRGEGWKDEVCSLITEYQAIKRVIDVHDLRVHAVETARLNLQELDKK